MEIIFATNNPHKLAEVQAKVGDSFKLRSLNDIGFSGDIPETGETLEANAGQKARYIFDRYQKPVIADDSGLEVLALNGNPGVDTAHYAGSRDANANMEKVLTELTGKNDRSATFRTVIAYIDGRQAILFQGEVEGRITGAMTGAEGFGYDPIFIPNGRDKTFAEMGAEAKSEISHRIRALEKFKDFLVNYTGSEG